MAEAEGLDDAVQPSDSNSGYRNVHKDCRSQAEAKPFEAYVQRAGENERKFCMRTSVIDMAEISSRNLSIYLSI